MKYISNFSNSEITAAGKTLVGTGTKQEVEDAELLVNEWREHHYWAIMGIQANVRNHVKRMSVSNAIVVQRLKKMATIKRKLIRFPKMKLHRMQDIGGCRAIFTEVASVYELKDRLINASMQHEVLVKKDYINEPKKDGYRGIHLTANYKSKTKPSYNGLKVKIQIRTYSQHLWSTAVETVGTFLNCSLKSGEGQDEWLTFFKMISSLIAIDENCVCISNTSSNRQELIEQITNLNEEFLLLEKLSTISTSCNYMRNKKMNSSRTYVIVIKEQGKKCEVEDFLHFEQANKYYIEKEKNVENNAVLVSAASLAMLKKAYPNYFMDISGFLELTNQLLTEVK